MSRISFWLSVGLFLAGCAWSVAIAIGQSWFTHHAYIVWLLWIAASLCGLLALLELLLTKHRRKVNEAFERGRSSVLSSRVNSPVGHETQTASGAGTPLVRPRITGQFSKVALFRQGLITENREHGQTWMFCEFEMQVSLSATADVHLEAIYLQTHRNRPFSRRINARRSPERTDLVANQNHSFRVYPQVEYESAEAPNVPDSLEMVIVDELRGEHIIHLRDGDQWPSLPAQAPGRDAPRVVFEYEGQAVSSKMHEAIRVVPFTLRNAGGSDALNVRIQEIRNGNYATREIEIGCIAPGNSPRIVEPIVEHGGRAVMLNGMPELLKALEKSDVTDPETLVTAKRAIPVRVTYSDFDRNRYESVFEIVHTYLGEKTAVRFIRYSRLSVNNGIAE